MGGKMWAMGWSPTAAVARQDAIRESTIDSILSTEKAEKAGVTREGLANIRRFKGPLRGDTPPTLSEGVPSPALVRGERFTMIDHHTNAHGERVIEASRPIGGGRFETVRIHEAQASEFSRIVSQVRG